MWYKSLLLHPVANRFNAAYLFVWVIACLQDPGPSPLLFWGGLGLEALYVGARLGLEFSGRPLFQLRFLKKDTRERYFGVMKRVRQIKTDFRNVGQLSTLLEGQMRHVNRMASVFLELLILRSRIDAYVRGIHENYDQKISDIQAKVATAEGEVKQVFQQNLEIYKQRRAKYFEVMGKRAIIEARLDTIENTLNLLGDYAMGMAAPGPAQDQIELLVSNIQDAEMFVSDVKSTVPQVGSLRMRVRA
ncbi:MAG: hypothetical protein M5R36_09550 [Deltaproteobacteria bacterium]|nr:hypothetical protein [Deltaproteobacteria bacterium]